MLTDKLEAQGISVWVDVASIDAGADFLSKIGEAIIDAKVRRPEVIKKVKGKKGKSKKAAGKYAESKKAKGQR